MPDRPLPPSRFGAGHTVGAPTPPAPYASAPPPTPPAPYASAPRHTSAGAPPPVLASPAQPTNGLAGVAFALAVFLGPLAAPVAIALGVVAQRQSARLGQAGAGLAKSAVFIGAAYLVLAAVVVGLLLLGGH